VVKKAPRSRRSSRSGDKLILYRRAADKPKKQPKSAMADLTA
jgi:hypothetical protein